MVRQHSYNLRKRRLRNGARRDSFPKPQIGDDVSIFWEALKKNYDGTLTRFDDYEKTFLVHYDEIPDGYDCASIWENLDYVPWRFLDRSEQRERKRTGMRTRSSRKIREGEGYSWKPMEWFDPGDLSAAYPEFDLKESTRWNRRKKKRTREVPGDHFGSQEDKAGNSALVSGFQDDSKDESHGDGREIQILPTERRSFQETITAAYSSERQRSVSGTAKLKKRRYADFGEHGFKSVRHDSSSGAGNANDCINSAPCRFLKTTRETYSERDEMRPRQRQIESKKTQQHNCFIVRTGHHIPNQFAPTENGSTSPSVEEQIRTIIRTMGVWNQNCVTPTKR